MLWIACFSLRGCVKLVHWSEGARGRDSRNLFKRILHCWVCSLLFSLSNNKIRIYWNQWSIPRPPRFLIRRREKLRTTGFDLSVSLLPGRSFGRVHEVASVLYTVSIQYSPIRWRLGCVRPHLGGSEFTQPILHLLAEYCCVLILPKNSVFHDNKYK